MHHYKKIRYTFVTIEDTLPLFVESVGFNPAEQDFVREEGYPYYHWLQTVEGQGRFHFNGNEYVLPEGRGVLLKPYTPHSYFTYGKKWSTIYVTFGGASIISILDSLKLNFSTLYTEMKQETFIDLIMNMINITREKSEFSKLELSSCLYQFLINLRKYGKINNQPSLSHFYDKIRPIVEWLETVYAEDIGLQDMAEHLNVSSQYLNRLFQDTFNVSPYSFLIQLRIRKAKEILIHSPDTPLKNVAFLVGFNDVSNFVATFKKKEGITPKKYRNLLVKNKTMNLKSERA
ncbi:AraC family transcriptional regulator [Evansella cellulosilytica]|uniref:Transcriptional regulator, AraC family n=1 Tax=Evansella cellulosilytica (strain ATCC 21833 / DSM 2522 / FERM P-1141 / JCM 9156 / N-4) TaxID=649639 RepID=E6TY04_EVAC2|nr:AraC family transcriptional regulator [Evansella cellulosilytica]ADU31217.1 transcriptional regulator, AraC family [Evansella cellulosilytica DSM 2522]